MFAEPFFTFLHVFLKRTGVHAHGSCSTCGRVVLRAGCRFFQSILAIRDEVFYSSKQPTRAYHRSYGNKAERWGTRYAGSDCVHDCVRFVFIFS